jgi:predicted RecA/RadA family phage recombinase
VRGFSLLNRRANQLSISTNEPHVFGGFLEGKIMAFTRRTSSVLIVVVSILTVPMPAVAAAQGDTTPPELVSFSFAPSAIDTTGSDQTVNLTLRITDALAGVSHGCFTFFSPSGQGKGTCLHDPNDITSGDEHDGVYQGVFTVPQFSEAGTWRVQGHVCDDLSNCRSYSEADLIAAGFPTTLEVTSATDTTAPSLATFAFAPNAIDTSWVDQTVTLTMRITDALAGVSHGCFTFFSPSGQGKGTCLHESDLTSGDEHDGVYQAVFTVPQYSEAGTWRVQGHVCDDLSNCRSYSEADLIAEGFATTLEVTSNPSDTVGPALMNFDFTPSVINTSLTDRTVSLTMRITDALAGVSHGCFTFFSPGGQGKGTCLHESDLTSGDENDGVYQGLFTVPQFSETGTWHVQGHVCDDLSNCRSYSEADLIAAGFPTTLRVTESQYPTANAGTDQTLEATGPLTQATLDGSQSSDPDGDPLTFEWRDAANTVIGTTAIVNVMVPVGSNTYTLTVDDGNGSQTSDTVVVTVTDSVPPTVAVTRPNGGEKAFAGTPFLIEWTASDFGALSFFDVFYSVDGGNTFNPIPECTNVNGVLRSCTWNTPGPTTNTARIRVTATDGSGNAASDASNANFSIASGVGSITVTSPNSVEDWGVGSTQPIKYSHNLGSSAYVRIEISRDAGETWETINPSFKNTANGTGTFNWVVTGPTVSVAARIRVLWLNGPSVSDVSNADFSVSDAYVAVTTPVTPTAFGYQTFATQKWTTNLGSQDKVDVLLTDDAGTFSHTLATNVTATKKTASFTMPSLATGTNTGRIRVVWTSNGSVHGTTPVKLQVHPAYIKVTKPNLAGDGWTIGSSATILWASNLGTTEHVKIELSLDGGGTYTTIVASTPSDGSHNVTVQAGWVTQTARIRITWLDYGAVSDVGAEAFAIQ